MILLMGKRSNFMATTNYVWEFTNQRKLNKNEFLHYVEKKVFKTIRKYGMLPEDKKIVMAKSDNLNSVVLKHIIEKKFAVEYGDKPNFSSESLTDVSEGAFKNVLGGKFEGLKAKDKVSRPLYDISEKEIEKYAELIGLKGKKKKRDPKIQKLFERFMKKNPDLDHNIVNAMGQIENL